MNIRKAFTLVEIENETPTQRLIRKIMFIGVFALCAYAFYYFNAQRIGGLAELLPLNGKAYIFTDDQKNDFITAHKLFKKEFSLLLYVTIYEQEFESFKVPNNTLHIQLSLHKQAINTSLPESLITIQHDQDYQALIQEYATLEASKTALANYTIKLVAFFWEMAKKQATEREQTSVTK